MSIELINWLLGGGGLLSIVTLIINSVMQRKKNKLDNLEKETTIEGSVTKSIQDAYNLFVKDYKDKSLDLMDNINKMEDKVEKLSELNADLQCKYTELSKVYTQLQIAYDILKKDYESMLGKYNCLNEKYNEIKKEQV